MAPKYWIKLYHEVLHDPKMGQMSDHLWRRTIELFLLAGEHGEDGSLPSLADMAWILRTGTGELVSDLEQLESLGIVSQDDGECSVTNFSKRQAAMTGAERLARYREEKRKEQYFGNEPVTEPVTKAYVEPEERREEREEDRAIAPSPPKTKAEHVPIPAAVKEYRRACSLYPAKSWYEKIDFLIGDLPDNLERWYRTCYAWVGLGWKPTNVQGMLECYQRNEIPGDNGKTGPPPAVSLEPSIIRGLNTTPEWLTP